MIPAPGPTLPPLVAAEVQPRQLCEADMIEMRSRFYAFAVNCARSGFSQAALAEAVCWTVAKAFDDVSREGGK